MIRKYFIVLLSIFSVSCATTPEETVSPPVVPGGENGFAELEESAAAAIIRAEAVGAEMYSPDLLEEAYDKMERASSESDGMKKKELLNQAIEDAEKAYTEAVLVSRNIWMDRIEELENRLANSRAELFMPDYDRRSRELLTELTELIRGEKNEEALALYEKVIPAVNNVVLALESNLDWLNQLSQEAGGLQGEANRKELMSGIAKEYKDMGTEEYEAAYAAYGNGNLPAAEILFQNSRYYFRRALMKGSEGMTPGLLDDLLMQSQALLEDAAIQEVVDIEGNRLEVSEWSAQEFLEEHPLVPIADSNFVEIYDNQEPSALIEANVGEDFFQNDYDIPENGSGGYGEAKAQLSSLDLPYTEQNLGPLPSAAAGLRPFEIPPYQLRYYSQEFGSMGEQQQNPAERLLGRARKSWENGVLARNAGDLVQAEYYFKEAVKLVEQYNLEYAVVDYYVVRSLVPADCLWRIAGYDFIYGDPFQWNRIHKRNSHLIKNPSLIYPGQRFAIPPGKPKISGE